ncbi:MAG: hypothetical protein M0R17_06950 [Candidatus Omnitrophica bacterium]|jgi:hypothetical protein|nr:hypothetical protein [Candidatus Omnitrophota bacterium]
MKQSEVEIITNLFNEKIKTLYSKLDAEFFVLNERINTSNATSDRIEKQVILTNSRVTHAEDDIREIEKDINLLKDANRDHIVACPQADNIQKIADDLIEKKGDTEKKLRDINIDLIEYRMFKKYPKIAIGVLAFTCITTVIGAYITYHQVRITTTNIDNNSINIDENTKNIKNFNAIDSLQRK